MWVVTLLALAASSAVFAAPAPAPAPDPGPQAPAIATPNKSAFVPAFDEIVVESSLMVKGRSGPTPVQRQGRTKLLVVPTPGTPLNATTSTITTTSSTTTTTTTAATVLT